MIQPPTPCGFPPGRYPGAGERSARLHPGHAEPEVGFAHGATCEVLATGAGTGGPYGLHRWTFGEQEAGAAPHVHRSTTQSFYVLEGRVRLFDGDSWRVATAGDFLHVPPGGIHGFTGFALATPASTPAGGGVHRAGTAMDRHDRRDWSWSHAGARTPASRPRAGQPFGGSPRTNPRPRATHARSASSSPSRSRSPCSQPTIARPGPVVPSIRTRPLDVDVAGPHRRCS